MTSPRLRVWSRLALWAGLSSGFALGLGSPLGLDLQSGLGSRVAQGSEPELSFTRDIQPILSNNCFRCHGPDPEERKGGTEGVRLDTFEGATADLGGYAAIVPGHPEKSEAVTRILATDPDVQMPPAASGKRLTARDRELLQLWIKQGAKYAPHWSYAPLVRPAVPAVKNSAWPKNDIDRFLLARLEQEKLSPAPEADRYALARRAALDLTGLPPNWSEVQAFVADQDPQAYEKYVDRLLQKSSYGEHWAHMWLDLARYADSAGYADDPPRTIWLYRDYVIRSFNENKSFAQFTREQIAGDLLKEPTQDQLIATAFHRNTLTNNEGGTNDEEFRNVAVVDRVNTTLAVWMGTTMSCAQCHNHKYDPLSQEEFFQFFAFFNNTEDADRGDESPLLSIYTPEQLDRKTQLQSELARLETLTKTATPELLANQAKWEAAFPRTLDWTWLKPASVTTKTKNVATIEEDGTVFLEKAEAKDVYTVELPLVAGELRALRLEARTHEKLPGKGPGHAGGNFVVQRVHAELVLPDTASLTGRYVRITLPGKQKILALAEVQIFGGEENFAQSGEASQSSVDYEGPANLAIDGQTDGNYAAKSTTHTKVSDDPWWEVDLKEPRAIHKLVVWNRTDNGHGARLQKFEVRVLDEKREPVWQTTVDASPNPSVELVPSGPRPIAFAQAVADFTQAMLAPDDVLKAADPKKGWGIGGQTGQEHGLVLRTAQPVEVPADSKLRLTLTQESQFANHVLGRFRIALTKDEHAETWGRTPRPVLSILETAPEMRSPEQLAKLTSYFLEIAPELADARKQLATVQKDLADLKPMTVPIQRELAENKRRITKLQHRGNFLDLGKTLTEATPAVFPPLPADAPRNRLTLADWLISEQNPLTPRVIANRYWEQVFGIGIVSTSEEFGAQGDLPVHPELLDWLGSELVQKNWDLKAFLKMLVTSAAYRQSSKVSPELMQRDPDNRLLARGPRFRLSAEMVRDQALAVSGLLSPKLYGPPVKPPQPSLGVNAAFGSSIDWQTSKGEDRYRRALYTTWRRSNPYPSMAAFDAPNREVCTLKRGRTNTPLQALVTLNDPVYMEAAQALARKIVQEGSTPVDRVRIGIQTTLSRSPHEAELKSLVGLYERALARFQAAPAQAAKFATDPLGPAPSGVEVPELAAWTVVSNVLLNLDEMFMKR